MRSVTKVLDWIIPVEWNIVDAYVKEKNSLTVILKYDKGNPNPPGTKKSSKKWTHHTIYLKK